MIRWLNRYSHAVTCLMKNLSRLLWAASVAGAVLGAGHARAAAPPRCPAELNHNVVRLQDEKRSKVSKLATFFALYLHSQKQNPPHKRIVRTL